MPLRLGKLSPKGIALEVALKLRERVGGVGVKVTALTFGPDSAAEILRKALAMRADEAVHVKAEGVEKLDSFDVAGVLSAAIQKLEPADLVICGRQAGDTDAGQVGLVLAEELGLPTITAVTDVEVSEDALRFRRESERGIEVVEGRAPALVTVTNAQTNVPRIPKVKDMMTAHAKPIKAFALGDLGVSMGASAHARIQELFIPVRERKCELVPGDSPEELAGALARRMLELKVL